MPSAYVYLAVVFALMTVGRIVWQPGPKAVRKVQRGIDWNLVVAFIRLDFPPEQRDIAQRIAAGLAEIVGMKIKDLRPDITLGQIAEWAGNSITPADLIKLFAVAFGVVCDQNSSFKELVERVVEKRSKT